MGKNVYTNKDKKAYIKNGYILHGKFRLTHLKFIILKINLDIYKKTINWKGIITHENIKMLENF